MQAVDAVAAQPGSKDHTVQSEVARVVEPTLEPGERLLWCGRPTMRPLIEGHELITPLVSLVLAAAVFQALTPSIGEVPAQGSEPMRLLLASMMVAFTTLAVWTPLRNIMRRRRSYYGLTETRAIVVERGAGGAVRSFPLAWDAVANLRLGSKSVSIIFELTRAAHFEREMGFEQLADGMAVFRLIRRLQARSAPRS
ncbi:MAG: hypothetical protein AAF899_07415 [Pseudomonadota bacterium]